MSKTYFYVFHQTRIRSIKLLCRAGPRQLLEYFTPGRKLFCTTNQRSDLDSDCGRLFLLSRELLCAYPRAEAMPGRLISRKYLGLAHVLERRGCVRCDRTPLLISPAFFKFLKAFSISIPVQIQIYIIYRICPAQPRTRVREKKIGASFLFTYSYCEKYGNFLGEFGSGVR